MFYILHSVKRYVYCYVHALEPQKESSCVYISLSECENISSILVLLAAGEAEGETQGNWLQFLEPSQALEEPVGCTNLCQLAKDPKGPSARRIARAQHALVCSSHAACDKLAMLEVAGGGGRRIVTLPLFPLRRRCRQFLSFLHWSGTKQTAQFGQRTRALD